MQKKKGISLIVLVITIIVMIILAAAIVISLNNSGIIERANDAVKAYNQDELDHIASLAWSEAYLDGARTVSELTTGVRTGLTNAGLNPDDYGMIVTTTGVTISKGWLQDGLNITKGNVTLEAGDLIQYNAGVAGYTGAWKLLGAEDGKLLIMSTTDVDTLGLYGAQGGTKNEITYEYGLLNGIDRLNEICEVYAGGTGAVGGRSIKGEDVNKLTEYDLKTYGVNDVKQYGNKVTLSWSTTTNGKLNYTSTNGENGTLRTNFSRGFTYVDFNKMTITTVDINSSELPQIPNNGYAYNVSNTTLATASEKAKELIFNDNASYWLDSPFMYMNASNGWFGILYVYKNSVEISNWVVSGDGQVADRTHGVRAVVELSPNITIGEKDNTLGWSYTI